MSESREAEFAQLSAAIDRDFEDHLSLLRTFLAQPSVSSTGEGIGEMATMVRDSIVEEIGGSAEVFQTAGHPIVLGRLDVGAERTLLVYGMYDVQPVDGEDWIVGPYSGDEVDLPGFGPSVVSRGIMNSKGPLANFISTVKTIMSETGTVPVNLVFLVEGEEELGSISLPEFVDSHLDELTADAAIYPFYAQDPTGKVLMYLGAKGRVFIELTVRGGPWGGPRSGNVHSMNAGWFHNPAWVLTELLSSMMSDDQTRILIDGLYDSVRAPDAQDRELLNVLGRTFDPEGQLETYDVARFKHTETGADLMARYLFEPSLNINGLMAGDSGSNQKTIIPFEAVAKIDIRLVPDMTVDEVEQAIHHHVAKQGMTDRVTVRTLSGYPAGKNRIDDLPNGTLAKVYEAMGATVEPWPLVAGAVPFYLFTERLGINIGMGGLGHGGRQHAPDEYAVLQGMRDFEKSMMRFLYGLADAENDEREA